MARLIAATGNLKHQTALSVAYGAGLRASEVVALKVGDVDSQRKETPASLAGTKGIRAGRGVEPSSSASTPSLIATISPSADPSASPERAPVPLFKSP